MKKCRIVHINDGNHRELRNGGRFFAEHSPKMEEKLNQLLALGYEVKHVVSQYSPSVQGDTGAYMFYISGYTFYLEKDFGDDEDMNDDEEFEKIFSAEDDGGYDEDNDDEYDEDDDDEYDEEDDDEYDEDDDGEDEEEYKDFLEKLNGLSTDDLRKLLDEFDASEDFDEIDFED